MGSRRPDRLGGRPRFEEKTTPCRHPNRKGTTSENPVTVTKGRLIKKDLGGSGMGGRVATNTGKRHRKKEVTSTL